MRTEISICPGSNLRSFLLLFNIVDHFVPFEAARLWPSFYYNSLYCILHGHLLAPVRGSYTKIVKGFETLISHSPFLQVAESAI